MEDVAATRVQPDKNRGGEWTRIGMEYYLIPPLAFSAIKNLAADVDKLKDMRGMPTADQVDSVVNLLHAAMSRNYTGLSRAEVEDMLDLGNIQEVLMAVMSISGFRRAVQGEVVAQSSPSTGMASTAP